MDLWEVIMPSLLQESTAGGLGWGSFVLHHDLTEKPRCAFEAWRRCSREIMEGFRAGLVPDADLCNPYGNPSKPPSSPDKLYRSFNEDINKTALGDDWHFVTFLMIFFLQIFKIKDLAFKCNSFCIHIFMKNEKNICKFPLVGKGLTTYLAQGQIYKSSFPSVYIYGTCN